MAHDPPVDAAPRRRRLVLTPRVGPRALRPNRSPPVCPGGITKRPLSARPQSAEKHWRRTA